MRHDHHLDASAEHGLTGQFARWGPPLVIALLTFVTFLPVLHNGFVSWDDDKNFLLNYEYRGLGWTQLRWMWSTTHLGHYTPLSWMTLGMDYGLWGMNPSGYHLTNLLLHSANAVVVYFIARRVLGKAVPRSSEEPRTLAAAATLSALLFAIHPLRVESVAWVTERRDVLSGCFYFSAVLCYLRACDGGDARRRWYWPAVGLCACALLSKATAVTLPAVLLLLNVYPLKRLGWHTGVWNTPARRVYVELAPFALLAAATVPVTFAALQTELQLSIPLKIAVSAYSLGFYIWKTIAPLHLAALYPMPSSVNAAGAPFLLSYGVVIAFVAFAWLYRRRWPGLPIACLAFVAMLFPLLGLHQNGPQIAADRYTYAAAPALTMLAGAALLLLKRPLAIAPRATSAGVLVALGALTWNQTATWHDSEALWTRALQVEPNSPLAQNNMANVLMGENRVDDAIAHYSSALSLKPDYADAHDNMGVALAQEGFFPNAIAEFQQALALDPSFDAAEFNWGAAAARQGDFTVAIGHYQRALAINPRNATAHVNWGNALVLLARPDEAIAHYKAALAIRPEHAGAHMNWGVALAQAGKLDDAAEHFRAAIALDPGLTQAHEYLQRILEAKPRPQAISP